MSKSNIQEIIHNFNDQAEKLFTLTQSLSCCAKNHKSRIEIWKAGYTFISEIRKHVKLIKNKKADLTFIEDTYKEIKERLEFLGETSDS